MWLLSSAEHLCSLVIAPILLQPSDCSLGTMADRNSSQQLDEGSNVKMQCRPGKSSEKKQELLRKTKGCILLLVKTNQVVSQKSSLIPITPLTNTLPPLAYWFYSGNDW